MKQIKIIVLSYLLFFSFSFGSDRETENVLGSLCCCNFSSTHFVPFSHSFCQIKMSGRTICSVETVFSAGDIAHSVSNENKIELTTKQNRHTTKIRNFFSENKMYILFSSLCMGTAVTSFVFNIKARNSYNKETEYYNNYINAGKGIDCNHLWNEFENAKKKTDRYITLQNIFGTSTAVVGFALYLSFALE